MGLLDTDDLERSDVLKCCDVVVATPELAADLYERDVEFFDDLKVAWLHPFPTSQNRKWSNPNFFNCQNWTINRTD